MQYFTTDLIDFFLDLEENNNKEWFHANKKRYETHVRKPMITLTADLIEEMQKYDPKISGVASKCLGRINRDIRFSKDKTPYNQHMWAHISKGTKQEPIPGIAYRFGGRDCGIMTGYYNVSKNQLNHLRRRISENIPQFQKLKSAKKFVELYGTIRGDQYKRLPSELQEIQKEEPLIANKQFYYVAEKKAIYATSSTLLSDIMEHWLAAKPLNDFFE
ncbi:MAG: DUF2461 domain-containing protein [Bacteroidota bacterium]